MIPDKLFKSLNHNYLNFKIFSKGEEIEKGYKPDFVLNNINEYVILESENTSSRKTFVGGLLKAAHFLKNEKEGILIFVLVPKKNTKTESIAFHLQKYFDFIKPITNLKTVFIIEAEKYYYNDFTIGIQDEEFIKNCYVIE